MDITQYLHTYYIWENGLYIIYIYIDIHEDKIAAFNIMTVDSSNNIGNIWAPSSSHNFQIDTTVHTSGEHCMMGYRVERDTSWKG